MGNYSILDELKITVNITNNPYHFAESDLFEMAMRINKNRSFLFVSKVLGKHLALKPQLPLLMGQLLAMEYMHTVHGIQDTRAESIAQAITNGDDLQDLLEKLEKAPIYIEEPTKIIGFAETATALGHAFFSAFSGDVSYIHTTREKLIDREPIIAFEEEHSHATSHRVYAQSEAFFEGSSEMILVDDEITTGKTNLNIIRQMKDRYPHKRSFTIVSILDWRSEEDCENYARFEKEFDIKIHAVSLMKGRIQVKGMPQLKEPIEKISNNFVSQVERISLAEDLNTADFFPYSSQSEDGRLCTVPYFKGTGRFSLTSNDEKDIKNRLKAVGTKLKKVRKGNRTLVIGTGEFMYVPMRIATELGKGILFHSTTRSPIFPHENSLIFNKFRFNSPEHSGAVNYLYNILESDYDEVFVIIERITNEAAMEELVAILQQVKIPYITVVTLANV